MRRLISEDGGVLLEISEYIELRGHDGLRFFVCNDDCDPVQKLCLVSFGNASGLYEIDVEKFSPIQFRTNILDRIPAPSRFNWVSGTNDTESRVESVLVSF